MGMNTEVIEPMGTPEIFVDGFESFVMQDGILTCSGYRWQRARGNDRVKVAVLKIVMPGATLGEAIEKATAALHGERILS